MEWGGGWSLGQIPNRASLVVRRGGEQGIDCRYLLEELCNRFRARRVNRVPPGCRAEFFHSSLEPGGSTAAEYNLSSSCNYKPCDLESDSGSSAYQHHSPTR